MFDLPEKVTYWNIIGGSSYAGYAYSAPVVIDARYAFRTQKIVDRNGSDATSSTAVYFNDTGVTIDSKIFIGESTSIEPPSESKDIINFAATPSGTDLRVGFL